MIYSVYDYDRKVYDYFDGPGPSGTHAGRPPIRKHKALGATPEQASWIVPMSARKVGSGPLPRGRIATMPGGAAMGDVLESTPAKLGALGVLGYVAYKLFGGK